MNVLSTTACFTGLLCFDRCNTYYSPVFGVPPVFYICDVSQKAGFGGKEGLWLPYQLVSFCCSLKQCNSSQMVANTFFLFFFPLDFHEILILLQCHKHILLRMIGVNQLFCITPINGKTKIMIKKNNVGIHRKSIVCCVYTKESFSENVAVFDECICGA